MLYKSGKDWCTAANFQLIISTSAVPSETYCSCNFIMKTIFCIEENSIFVCMCWQVKVRRKKIWIGKNLYHLSRDPSGGGEGETRGEGSWDNRHFIKSNKIPALELSFQSDVIKYDVWHSCIRNCFVTAQLFRHFMIPDAI